MNPIYRIKMLYFNNFIIRDQTLYKEILRFKLHTKISFHNIYYKAENCIIIFHFIKILNYEFIWLFANNYVFIYA